MKKLLWQATAFLRRSKSFGREEAAAAIHRVASRSFTSLPHEGTPKMSDSIPVVHPVLDTRHDVCNTDLINSSAFGYWNDPKTRYWTGCRETLHSYLWTPFGRSKRTIPFYFRCSHLPFNRSQVKLNIARMLWYLERRMGWQERTQVHDMKHERHVAVLLSPGWLQNTMSASLVSLMIRLGRHCSEEAISSDGHFDDLLDISEIARTTKPAIYLFLEGLQHYRGPDGQQWRGRFRDLNKRNAKKWLMERAIVEARARKYWEEAGSPKKKPSVYDADFWEPYWLQACRYYYRA